jgi:hypothetical protein
MKRTKLTLALALCSLLAACGGGGGSDGSAAPADPTTPVATTVNLQNFDAAVAVIGQADFVSGGSGTTDHNLDSPYGSPAVAPDGRLFVGDYGNNRVLGFSSVPEANGASASLVLGAPDFTTSGAGGATRSTLGGPQQVAFSGSKMIVAEYDNNRVVIYNAVPADSSAVPDVVLGQPDFITANPPSCAADSMNEPETVAATSDGKIIVTDSGHNRVLIWNSVPTTSGALPDVVLGQGDFTHCNVNDDAQAGADAATPTARTLQYPAGIWSDGQRLVVADTRNSRVLIWNTFPTTSFKPADIVLGQGSMTANAANDDDQDGSTDASGKPTARTMSGPYDGVASNGTQLAIADSENNRVLVWNTFPTTNFQPADVVLGQSSMTMNASNDDDQDGNTDTPNVPSARTLWYPTGVAFDSTHLIVVDEENDRLLVFKSR